jgi:hypothetical protein
VPVIGGPFRIDDLARIDALGGDRCRFELVDEVASGREHIQPGRTDETRRGGRPGRLQADELDYNVHAPVTLTRRPDP